MKSLSTSLTLGKASTGNANVAHNNRDFFADNVDVNRICDNIIYANQDVREAYDELFSESLAAYNATKKQPCRRIHDYFEHIENGNREEPYYELVIQFGDMKTAGIGTPNGEIVKKLLDEYARGFQARNPNLHVFNSTMHLDEASPHLHINFIPYYTQGRKLGLSQGVSMKSALIEQGFVAKSKSQNHLILWQDSERKYMEQILKRYGISREVKNADYAHQSVDEYKESQDVKRLQGIYSCSVSQNEITAANVDRLKTENALLEIENQKLTVREHSPYKSFYYSDLKKQTFVIAELERLQIPFRETDNGLEAKDCYVEEIRKIEKSYKSHDNPHRDTLRNQIDLFVMQSQSFDDFLEKLKSEYTVKQGKYLAVLPQHSSQYIRLKSLGAEYSEQAIRNRIFDKREFENDNLKKFHALKDKDSPEAITRKNIRHYTIIFAKGMLPMRKVNKRKPFAWTNCEQLNQLALLNRKINAGATPESLRWHLANTEKSISEIEGKIKTLKSELRTFNDLYNAGVRYYGNNGSDRRDYELLTERKITAVNYHRITKLITDNENEIAELENSLSGERVKYKDFADTLTLMDKVLSTTYVQGLVDEEKHRRQSKFVINGLKSADSSIDELRRVDEIVNKVTEPSKPPPETPQYRPKRK